MLHYESEICVKKWVYVILNNLVQNLKHAHCFEWQFHLSLNTRINSKIYQKLPLL